MTLYVDQPIWPWRNRLWAHLITDGPLAELHAAAQALGIPERAFDADHYDIPQERWDDAVAYGARPVSSRDVVRILRQAGLRSPKHLRRQAS